VIISIVAEAYGLPFLPANMNKSKDQDIKKGVNFAFAGATVLNVEYYVQNGLPMPDTNNSLSIQLGWFKTLKPSLCKSKEGFTISSGMFFFCETHEFFTIWQTNYVSFDDRLQYLLQKFIVYSRRNWWERYYEAYGEA